MNSRERVTRIMQSSLLDLSKELAIPAPEDLQTRLIGSSSPFDSMALVSLIADLEARIADEFGKDVVLADERAMSSHRSPFRSAATLIEHIVRLLEEDAP